MENTKKLENWLDQEEQDLKQNDGNYEKLPSLVLEENKVTAVIVDASRPFEKWNDTVNKSIKAKVPVLQNGEKKIFWLNIKNPLYKDLVHECRESKNKELVLVKIFRTGTKTSTRYSLIKE